MCITSVAQARYYEINVQKMNSLGSRSIMANRKNPIALFLFKNK